MSPGRITLCIASSVDGFSAAEDGSVAWLEAYGNGDASYEEFFADVDRLVMGSKAYEQALGFGEWPYERGNRRTS